MNMHRTINNRTVTISSRKLSRPSKYTREADFFSMRVKGSEQGSYTSNIFSTFIHANPNATFLQCQIFWLTNWVFASISVLVRGWGNRWNLKQYDVKEMCQRWTILEYSLGQTPTHLTGWPHLWGQSSMYVATVALLLIMNWVSRGVLATRVDGLPCLSLYPWQT